MIIVRAEDNVNSGESDRIEHMTKLKNIASKQTKRRHRINLTTGQSLKEICLNLIKIHGYKKDVDLNNPLYFYGSDEEPLLKLSKEKGWNATLSNSLGVIEGQVVWAVQNEMALNVDDFLARRRRSLFLNARLSVEMAPRVAELMKKELKKPISNKFNCPNEKPETFFIKSKPVAAAIVGTAKRKENSTIILLLNPNDNPPIIVAAERDTPGIKAID